MAHCYPLPALALCVALAAAPGLVSFTEKTVDTEAPRNPWVKLAGDLDGDGLADLVVGGQKGTLVWYRAPEWKKYPIADGGYSTVTGDVGDINRDGHLDIVLGGTVWYENPGRLKSEPARPWTMHTVAEDRTHDAIVADFNRDGLPDIATRNQSDFGHQAGDRIRVFLQTAGGVWQPFTIACEHGEGIVAADLDRDGDADIVTGGVWFETVQEAGGARWVPHRFTQWHAAASVAVGDINGDGRPDVVLAPSELAKQWHKLSWFAAPPDPKTGPWRERVVAEPAECVMHGIQAADIDLDGHPDIVYAEMHQGQDPDEVGVFFNRGRGGKWVKQVVAGGGSHDIQVADLDGDGDLDLFGANWSGPFQPVQIWVNGLRSRRK